MKNSTKKIMFILFIPFFFIGISKISDYNGEKLLREEIEQEYEGVVIKKYSTRDTEPTFIKIKTQKGILDLKVYSETIDKMKIGDTLKKKTNSLYGIIITPDGNKRKEPLFNQYVLDNYNHKKQ